MKQHIHEIKVLIEKMMNGQTTPDEQKRLAAYFRETNYLPEELTVYTSLFQCLECPELTFSEDEKMELLPLSPDSQRQISSWQEHHRRWGAWMRYSGIAVAILLAFWIGRQTVSPIETTHKVIVEVPQKVIERHTDTVVVEKKIIIRQKPDEASLPASYIAARNDANTILSNQGINHESLSALNDTYDALQSKIQETFSNP